MRSVMQGHIGERTVPQVLIERMLWWWVVIGRDMISIAWALYGHCVVEVPRRKDAGHGRVAYQTWTDKRGEGGVWSIQAFREALLAVIGSYWQLLANSGHYLVGKSRYTTE